MTKLFKYIIIIKIKMVLRFASMAALLLLAIHAKPTKHHGGLAETLGGIGG